MSLPDHIKQRGGFLTGTWAPPRSILPPLRLGKTSRLPVSSWKKFDCIFCQLLPWIRLWSTCMWELAGSFQETEKACGHFRDFLPIACSSIKIKSPVSLWKELVHTSGTPIFMTATWGMGSQITELREPTRLTIYQSNRTTLNNNSFLNGHLSTSYGYPPNLSTEGIGKKNEGSRFLPAEFDCILLGKGEPSF